jgi:hypothetical protein
VHNIYYSQSPKPDVLFCDYCETWIGPFDEPSAHTMSHENDATNLILDSGYQAPKNGRLLRPDLCIFCFHDPDLPPHQRIVSKAIDTQGGHFEKKHMSKIAENALTKCPAFPQMCTCDIDFSKEALHEHLNDTHGITTTRRADRRKRPT